MELINIAVTTVNNPHFTLFSFSIIITATALSGPNIIYYAILLCSPLQSCDTGIAMMIAVLCDIAMQPDPPDCMYKLQGWITI